MPLKLYELVGTDPSRPFSPFCWRTRMALAHHKGLSAETIPWCFTDKAAIAPHGSEKVPVLLDGDSAVVNSWTIANHLEDTYPDRPSLFGGAGGRALGPILNSWADRELGGMFPVVVADIPRTLTRRTRPISVSHARRVSARRWRKYAPTASGGRRFSPMARSGAADIAHAAVPLRLCCDYADYIVFGGFQWARWSARSSC